MKFFSIRSFPHAISLFLILLLASMACFADEPVTWLPITQADREMKTPVVDPTADAEAIFWDITIDDKLRSYLVYNHYVRVKIFTERGRERFAKLDLPFGKGKKVEDVAARVIRPDGSIVVLQPSEIFEREIVRSNKLKVWAKSFAVPGIEAGAIVEYKYSETYKNNSAGGQRLLLQRDIPMQKMSYHIRPFAHYDLAIRSYNIPSNTTSLNFVDDPNNKDFRVATITNVPALKEEPYMPPDDEVRRWAYLYYQTTNWRGLASFYANEFRDYTRISNDINARSAQITAGINDPSEKLRSIYDFVRTNIRNLSFDRAKTGKEETTAKVKNVTDILATRAGTSAQIDVLFAALAKAAGFEVAILLTGDRSDNFFTPEKYPFGIFIEPKAVAVIVDNKWKFCKPGTPYLPYGGLPWYEEQISSMMLASNGGYVWHTIPASPPDASPVKRTGRFKLLRDGNLEGSVTIAYEGHPAAWRRAEGYLSSPGQRETKVIEEATQNLKTAEIRSVAIENFDDPQKPLVYSYAVRVPGYAQKTGKRLFLQPGFFETGSQPVFSTATRTHPVHFPYSWSELDDIEIELPRGFSAGEDSAPADVSDPSNVGALKVTMQIDRAAGVLRYKREFYFGNNGKILFPANMYLAIRSLFGLYHKTDSYTLALAQE